MGHTKNFADVIRARMAADPALAKAIEDESFNADIAMKVYEARKEAGLTQKQLAERINTQQSVISRIESADYDGHSLSILKRIAHVLGKNLRVEFYACPVASTAAPTEADSRSFPLHWQQSRSWQPHIHQDEQVETVRTCQEDVKTKEFRKQALSSGRQSRNWHITDIGVWLNCKQESLSKSRPRC